jgi:hypothetical protein
MGKRARLDRRLRVCSFSGALRAPASSATSLVDTVPVTFVDVFGASGLRIRELGPRVGQALRRVEQTAPTYCEDSCWIPRYAK